MILCMQKHLTTLLKCGSQICLRLFMFPCITLTHLKSLKSITIFTFSYMWHSGLKVTHQTAGLELPGLKTTFITYANKFPYIILLTSTDQYFSISGV